MSGQDYPPTRNEAVAVGAASIEVSPAQERKVYTMKNNSAGAQRITLSYGPIAAVFGAGIILEPGDVVDEADGDFFRCFRGPIQAIASGAGGILAVFER
jgi:hypothetical protein